MQKVLIFSHNFPPAIDGGSQILFKIAQSLKKKGNEIVVLTSDALSTDDYINPKRKRLKPGWGRVNNLKVFRIKTFKYFPRIIKKIFLGGPIFSGFPISWVKKYQPKIIIGGVFPTLIPLYSWFLAKILKAKLVLLPCFHQDDQGFYNPWLIGSLKRADKVLALSRHEKRFYVKKLGIKSKKILIFRPPINNSFLLEGKAKFSKPPTLVYVGSQAAHKRIEFLIDAFERLAKDYKKLKLIIAGPRTLYSPIIDQRIKNLPVEIKKRVKVLGKFSEAKKKKLLDQAWVLVNPSVHESLGLVFLEAWARKKPVIAADIPILREIINDGENGFLFKKDDLNDLKNKIRKIVSNKRKTVRMGEEGCQNVVSNFTAGTNFKINID